VKEEVNKTLTIGRIFHFVDFPSSWLMVFTINKMSESPFLVFKPCLHFARIYDTKFYRIINIIIKILVVVVVVVVVVAVVVVVIVSHTRVRVILKSYNYQMRILKTESW